MLTTMSTVAFELNSSYYTTAIGNSALDGFSVIESENTTSALYMLPAYIRTTSMVACIVVMVLGILGNLMVPLVVLQGKDMRNSTNIFLVNLSVADLFVLVISTPSMLMEINSGPEVWLLGEHMCKAVPFVELTVAHASVLTILAISFERYYAICEPLRAGTACIVVSNMAAAECEAKENTSSDLLKSTVLSDETVKTIEEDEGSAIPLQTPWTFWLDKAIHGTTAEEYKANLQKIYTVNTVQNFWAVFNNIPNAGQMQVKYSYHLMRDDRYPLWEDKVNQKGGTWRLKCHKSDTADVWKEVVLAAIGEQFSTHVAQDDEICGVTVSIRDREDLIQIWNINATLESKATILQKVHSLVPNVNFLGEFYKPHQSHHAYGRH
ncbi:uncharacterized protein ETHR isoform X7 [Linepithema humile]|uniref:uncharacterized protein ETHR isoform X7 n=1 Tax=Linepithema humile TaxID=83485 RepID=UPI0006239C91|nr:PREDICTED: eukaryotic translation initiation factor NCBP isoform X5 [Linepithema humile]